VIFSHNAPIHWFIGSLKMNGYYREGNVSPLLSAGNNWRSVVDVFLDVHNSESALEVCPRGRGIACQLQW
jgi:hypothetical protein